MRYKSDAVNTKCVLVCLYSGFCICVLINALPTVIEPSLHACTHVVICIANVSWTRMNFTYYYIHKKLLCGEKNIYIYSLHALICFVSTLMCRPEWKFVWCHWPEVISLSLSVGGDVRINIGLGGGWLRDDGVRLQIMGRVPAAIFYVVLLNKTRPLNNSVMVFHNLVRSIAGIFFTR